MGPRKRASTPSGARSTLTDGRRRPDQPLRAVRRGGPRRRAREVRRTQSAGAATRKRRKPKWASVLGHALRPATGTTWRSCWPMTLSDGRSTSGWRASAFDAIGMRSSRDWRATAEVGVTNIAATVIAIRGERLVLSRYRFSGRDQRPEAFRHGRALTSSRSTTDQRITASVMLDLDDIDAAFAELDARYLAGEAAAHAHTWSLIARGLCRVQPTRAARDDAGLGEHRPPARDSVRARRS